MWLESEFELRTTTSFELIKLALKAQVEDEGKFLYKDMQRGSIWVRLERRGAKAKRRNCNLLQPVKMHAEWEQALKDVSEAKEGKGKERASNLAWFEINVCVLIQLTDPNLGLPTPVTVLLVDGEPAKKRARLTKGKASKSLKEMLSIPSNIEVLVMGPASRDKVTSRVKSALRKEVDSFLPDFSEWLPSCSYLGLDDTYDGDDSESKGSSESWLHFCQLYVTEIRHIFIQKVFNKYPHHYSIPQGNIGKWSPLVYLKITIPRQVPWWRMVSISSSSSKPTPRRSSAMRMACLESSLVLPRSMLSQMTLPSTRNTSDKSPSKFLSSLCHQSANSTLQAARSQERI